MDTLTHVLTGALIARAAAPARVAPGTPGQRARMAAGAIAAGFPDIDFVLRAVDTLWYLAEAHQSVTHSLVLLPLWAWLIARGCGWFTGLGWRGFFTPAVLGLAIHIAGDLLTAYGTMILYPLSDWRPSLSWLFVLDPWFTALAVLGLVIALRRPAAARTACIAALAALTTYAGAQAFQHQRALDIGIDHALARGLEHGRVEVLPQPLSPGHWMVVVSHGELREVAYVRLLPGRSVFAYLPWPGLFEQMSSAYLPAPEWRTQARFGTTPAERVIARAAWAQDDFEDFRAFARLPVLNGTSRDGARQCAWFHDLRFALPELQPSFVYGMCHDDGQPSWRLERRRGALWLD